MEIQIQRVELNKFQVRWNKHQQIGLQIDLNCCICMLYSEPDFNPLRCEVSSPNQDNTFHSDNLLCGVRVCNRVWNARMTDPES